MATITITIPDAILQRVLDGMVPFDPSPRTKAQVAKQMIITYIKQQVRTTEGETAIALGRTAPDVDVT